jgi:hypothetical protein
MHFMTAFAPLIAVTLAAPSVSDPENRLLCITATNVELKIKIMHKGQEVNNTCVSDYPFQKVSLVNSHRHGFCSAFLAGSGDRRSLWDVTESHISSACSCLATATPAASTWSAPAAVVTPAANDRRR